MMRKGYLVILLVCLSFLFVSTASAGMYIGGKLGYVMTTDSEVSVMGVNLFDIENDGAFGFGVALGTAIDNFRVEGEIEYRSASMDKVTADGDSAPIDGDVKTLSLMANGYYDFTMDSPLKPYVGAGIGFAKHSFEINSIDGDTDFFIDDSDTVFAYQFTVGAAWAVSDTMDLDLSYRYFATPDAEFAVDDVTLEASYGSHNIFAGLRFKF